MTASIRRLTALWALCFVVLSWGVEATGVHACPHHTRIGEGSSAANAAPDHAHHGSRHRAGHPAGHSDQHGGCTCAIGCPAGIAGLPTERFAAAARIESRVAPTPSASDAPRRSGQKYFLPYGLAPPVAA